MEWIVRVREWRVMDGSVRLFGWGSQPVNLQAGAYYNVIRPDYFANWNFRLQVVFMFPKRGVLPFIVTRSAWIAGKREELGYDNP